jgi:hypothetical protein
MKISTPTFLVKLHPTHLEVDLQKGTRKKLEDAIEAHPRLKESLGFLLQYVIHLDVALKDVEKVEFDKKKHVRIMIPNRRDITIPLEQKEAIKLINELNELIPQEKQREMDRLFRERETRRQMEREGKTVEGLEESQARMLARKRD